MKRAHRILLLEDDRNLGFVLKEQLEMDGYAVTLTTNGVDGQAEARNNDYALYLVDVMMPRKDGFTFAREARAAGDDTPIVFLTAKSLKEDRLEGFRSGGDDYVTKPFSTEELLLRIKAVLKRSTSAPPPEPTGRPVTLGSLTLDPGRQTLSKGRSVVTLTTKECGVLALLAARSGDVVAREEILTAVWGDASIYNSRSLDVFISKLRKHIARDPSLEIRSVHGVGYKLIAGRTDRTRSRT